MRTWGQSRNLVQCLAALPLYGYAAVEKPNKALVAPREARNLGIESVLMKLVVWWRKAQVRLTRASRSVANSVQPAMGEELEGRAGGGVWRPEMRSVVAGDISQGGTEGKADGFQWPEGSSPRRALASDGTPPGSQSGAGRQRGSAGTWESSLPPCHSPGMGERATKSPGAGRTASAIQRAGNGDTKPQEAGTVSWNERQAKDHERGRGQSERHRVPRG